MEHVFGFYKEIILPFDDYKLNNIRNAFDFVHFWIRKTVAFSVFVHTIHKTRTFLTSGVKDTFTYFVRTYLWNFDKLERNIKKYFRSDKMTFLCSSVSKILVHNKILLNGTKKNSQMVWTDKVKFYVNSNEKRFLLSVKAQIILYMKSAAESPEMRTQPSIKTFHDSK